MAIYAKILPGQDIDFFKADSMELEDMQKIVGGFIEAPFINQEFDDNHLTLFLNEEGKLKKLDNNIIVFHNNEVADIFVGPILITSTTDEGSSCGLSEEQISYLKGLFSSKINCVYSNSPTNYLYKLEI